MCANNLDPEIATYIGIAEPQNFDALVSKASNVERQPACQKNAQPRRGEGKSPIKKGESMGTFAKAQGHPMVKTATKMVSKGKRVDDLLSKKGNKRNTPLMMMMFKGYLMNSWLQKLFLSRNQSDLLRSIRQMILGIAHITGSLVIP